MHVLLVCKDPRRCRSKFLTMKESLTKKSYGITLSKHETTFHTNVFKFFSSNYKNEITNYKLCNVSSGLCLVRLNNGTSSIPNEIAILLLLKIFDLY